MQFKEGVISVLNAILPDTLLFIFYLLYVVFLIKRKKLTLYFHLLLFLTVVYVIAVISVTLFPLPIQRSYIIHMIINKQLGERNNFIPFHSILDTLRTAVAGSVILRQIGGNVLLLFPFGFLLPLLRKNISFKKTFLAGLSFSVVIEGLQYLISASLGFSYRSTDIDDVILNTTGACFGYLALRLILKVFVSNKIKHRILQSSSR